MDVEIRPITPDEFEAYLVALEVAFSARVEEGDLDRELSVAIPERFLAVGRRPDRGWCRLRFPSR